MQTSIDERQMTIGACVAEQRERRIAEALEEIAHVRFHDTLAGLVESIEKSRTPAVIIVDARDRTGDTIQAVAGRITAIAPATSIVLYASQKEILRGTVAAEAITDIILADETDSRAYLRRVVLDAVNRRAADRVARALRMRLPPSLAAFAEAAVRFPANASVQSVADHLGVHRQTAAVWSRKEKCLRPEELVMWGRLLLVAELLEKTNRPVAALSVDLDFPSVISLRNQLKRYTGLTGLEIRAAGFDAVLARFDESLERARSEPAATPRRASAGVLLAPLSAG